MYLGHGLLSACLASTANGAGVQSQSEIFAACSQGSSFPLADSQALNVAQVHRLAFLLIFLALGRNGPVSFICCACGRHILLVAHLLSHRFFH
mmetsp:Transcript_10783/g.25864  ORF Transcript_10783/g.25864 Transcript_10783/m.25864 type:complete len:93 (+) Transcript_10783:149-427(+)